MLITEHAKNISSSSPILFVSLIFSFYLGKDGGHSGSLIAMLGNFNYSNTPFQTRYRYAFIPLNYYTLIRMNAY